MSRNIFLDCGANNGCSVRKFRKLNKNSESFSIFSFECNLTLVRLFSEPNVKLIPAAVSNYDGYKTFYSHPHDPYASTTFAPKGQMLKDGTWKNWGKLKNGEISLKVLRCIDLSNFIKSRFCKKDFIILKLDVEGEEYNIIPHLLKTGCFEYINELWIEWHSLWLYGNNEIDKKLEKEISMSNTLIDNNWDAIRY